MVSVDAKKLLPHIYSDKYGVHRCATFGDFREPLKDLATFLGFDVVEEDA